MSQYSHKPLPAVPTHSKQASRAAIGTGRLTIEGRAHIRQFIKHALAEGTIESRDEWIPAIEQGLADLGESMAIGSWLAGLKASKREANAKRREMEREERRRQMQKLAEEKEAKEGKNKAKAKDKKEKHNGGESELKDHSPDTSMVSARTPEDTKKLALEQLIKVASSSSVPTLLSSPKHLLLTMTADSTTLPLPRRDLGFDIVPSSKTCLFVSGTFALRTSTSWAWTSAPESTVLYGLDEWDVDAHMADVDPVRLVGGTFTFKGTNSPLEVHTLTRTLRLSIFVYLSLILEQALLADSHVELKYPSIPAKPLVFTLSSPMVSPTKEVKRHSSQRSSPSGIWSFLSKKTGNLLHRATHVAQAPLAEYKRSGSLDLSRVSSALTAPRLSSEQARFSRRMSFSFTSNSHKVPEDEAAKNDRTSGEELLFDQLLSQINEYSSLMSTSAGVTFSPPSLLRALAEKEKEDPQRKLSGEDKMALRSILGWEGREAKGKNMSGMPAFVRHQGISALYVQYSKSAEIPPSPAPSSSSETTVGIPEELTTVQKPNLKTCSMGRWVTYRYYSQRSSNIYDEDRSLGDVVECLCENSEEECPQAGCELKQCEHQKIWMHDGVRITVAITKDLTPDNAPERLDVIRMWESCAICHKTTEPKDMSDGTYLMSFAKFLELLVHSPALCSITPAICEHTTPPRTPWAPQDSPPRSRINIIRHFRYRLRTIEIGLSIISDIYELRLPRLHLHRLSSAEANGNEVEKPKERKSSDASSQTTRASDETRKALRKEIKSWWQALSDHLGKLEEQCSSDDDQYSKKHLPRLPSADDDDMYGGESEEDGNVTPKGRLLELPPLPPSRPSSPLASPLLLLRTDSSSSSRTATIEHPDDPSSSSSEHSSKVNTPSKENTDKEAVDTSDLPALLSNLRYTFQRTEQSLYAQLSRTPNSNLNDVRRSFLAVARGASMRLAAWQKKHTNGSTIIFNLGPMEAPEPDWWTKGCHAVPGGRVVVRETEWPSLIAFTLSSLDYQKEMTNLHLHKGELNENRRKSGGISPGEGAPTASTILATTIGALFSPNTGFRPFSATAPLPDPDSDEHIWHTAEGCTAVISRQDHLRDPSALMSLRDVLRTRRSFDISGATFTSKFSPSKLIGASPRSVSTSGKPPSAWAKAAVEVNTQPADGLVSGLPSGRDSAERILMEMEMAAENISGSSSMSSSLSSSGFAEATAALRRAKGASTDSHMDETPKPSKVIQQTPLTESVTDETQSADSHSSISSVDFPAGDSESRSKVSRSSSTRLPQAAAGSQEPSRPGTPTASTITGTLTSTFTSAMRYIINTGENNRPMSPSHHHKLLTLESGPINDRPHIKYEWTIGKRLKFSCTVYFAKEFESLRKRCGVEDVMIKSLERSENWAAEGGKSRSNFWKTADGRFVIKTLVNAWNVADLQVLLDIAPSYFRYMESTANKPTVIAKLLGFYTVEIKNLETSTVQAKADLLVMENLFHDQNVSKTYDLKGIQGRKAKPNGGTRGNRILYDSDWIEGQKTELTLLRPHSKAVLTEAIKADADFLSKSNIMDYSLLLGVDEERHQIACGLVDTIGSYTFAKTLEYKAKQNLQSGKEVTVIPPTEYQERFIKAMNSYFLACPDKWTRPPQDSPSMYNDMILPSVL